MLPRITTIKPRLSSGAASLRAYDVTIIEPGHRATYTVLAPSGLLANKQATALYDGRAKPLVWPELGAA